MESLTAAFRLVSDPNLVWSHEFQLIQGHLAVLFSEQMSNKNPDPIVVSMAKRLIDA